MVLKESKGRMLASALLSTLTLTLSMPFQSGSLMFRIVRILVLPSGSISLLMLAIDFEPVNSVKCLFDKVITFLMVLKGVSPMEFRMVLKGVLVL